MIFSDRLNFANKIIRRNKKDWIQILLFSFTILMLLISLTAYFSYQRFGKIMLEDGINAHKIRVIGVDETNKELLDQLKAIEHVEIVKKEYETYIRAHANMTMLEFYSIPSEINFITDQVGNLNKDEMIVSNDLELEISGKKYKGKDLIGKWISITIEDTNVKKVKVVDSIDSSNYGIGNQVAFLSEVDMVKIADVQETLFDEYTTLDDIYIVFVENSDHLQSVYENIQKLGLGVDYLVSADSNAIKTIYGNIFLIFLISVVLFLGVKILYLKSYFNKEKNNVALYLTCGYTNRELFQLYNLKNILSSMFSFIITLVLYVIGIIIYSKVKEDLVSIGIKAVLPRYFIVSVFCVELIVNGIITSTYFRKIKEKEVSELIRYD